MTLSEDVRSFYTTPGPMTGTLRHPHALNAMPRETGELCKAIQGFVLHEHWAPAYRQYLTPERRAEVHRRSTDQVLDKVFEKNQAPLIEPRPLYQRVVGNCRHYSMLTVAALRKHGVPARARCGFGAYFERDKFADHWVAEVWDDARWKFVDAQIDPSQREILHLTFDPADTPRDQFIIAGEAWKMCREDGVDPQRFGIFDMRGLWFIAGNILRDFAALNNMEMLPWDCWGPAPGDDSKFAAEDIALFDKLAALARDPDAHFAEIRTLYESGERLRVPPVVFNAVLNKEEPVVL